MQPARAEGASAASDNRATRATHLATHPTPQWFTQSQALIAEMSRQRTADSWRRIQERGRMINQMSDADYSNCKSTLTSGSAQRYRINTLYETSAYKDSTGAIVNLPMHYKNVYSDGNGNYFLSNDSRDKPGEQWTAIEPVK